MLDYNARRINPYYLVYAALHCVLKIFIWRDKVITLGWILT